MKALPPKPTPSPAAIAHTELDAALHRDWVWSVAFDPRGTTVGSSGGDHTVKLWDPIVGRLLFTFEGHTDKVKCIAFRRDGLLLASKGADHTIRIWHSTSATCVAIIGEPALPWRLTGLVFHPHLPLLATVGSDPGTPENDCDRIIHIWELDLPAQVRRPAAPTITYTSAKVVLVGESNVGKSYLAHRIATGSRPEEGTIQSTHGMRFWPLEPDRPSPAANGDAEKRGLSSPFAEKLFGRLATVARNERRDIVLWDMGGQEEYRLIHQLFLHDTTVALVLFDPTRGATAFKEVEAWNKSLEKQLRGRVAVKLLVGAKVDQPSQIIDRQSLERLRHECGFAGYCETSALTGRGVAELCEIVAKAIDWNGLGKTRRPELFQRIRDEIEARRKRGEVVVKSTDLLQALVEHDPELRRISNLVLDEYVSQSAARRICRSDGEAVHLLKTGVIPQGWKSYGGESLDLIWRIAEELDDQWHANKHELSLSDLCRAVISKDVEAVTEQLATQGVVARSRISTGEPVLVLQVQEIERYAGSLILAARNNPRGVPAIELRAIAQGGFSLPGIPEKERLPRDQEKPAVECTVQLMLAHGICFQHEGLLIFPSLFAPVPEAMDAELPHTVSLYYDFAGAIDNIYASLVAWLVLAKEFGRVRLWSDRAEFEVKDGGLCGLLKQGRPGGFARVDVYFETETPERQRKEFISFVEDHLARNGVEIREHVAIKCACGHDFAEETLRQRIARGDNDVVCPVCETRHSLTEGAAIARERDAKLAQNTWALRTQIEKLREQLTKQVVQALAKAEEAKRPSGPIRLLHLSDLHFTKETPVVARLQWLLDDLKQDGGLGFKELDYLVISGDFTDKGCTEGFEKAYEFVSGLTQAFGLSAERCIFVPGNHDVVDRLDGYTRRKDPTGLTEGEWFQEGKLVMARDSEKYPLRFKPFSDLFYHKFVQRPYPMTYAEQGVAIPFWEIGIQFLMLNSCWQIDEFNRKRSGVHVEAVANAIRQAQTQEDDARKVGHLAKGKPLLRILVCHHAIAGLEQMRDMLLLGHLQRNHVQLALHGDVHEMRRELVRYWHEDRLHVIGSGSFGARDVSPRLYNVLEIARDLESVRVHTREQRTPDGVWDGWHEWPDPEGGKGRVAYYDVKW